MGPPELIVIGIIAIAVIFGAKKIPEIAHSLGRSSNEFKKGLKEGAEDEAAAPPSTPTVPPTSPTTTPPAPTTAPPAAPTEHPNTTPDP